MPSNSSALRHAVSYRGIELGIIIGRSETPEVIHWAETVEVCPPEWRSYRTEPPPKAVGKERFIRLGVLFVHPYPSESGDGVGQWSASFLPPLADAADVRTRTKCEVATTKSTQFGSTQAGLDSKQQQGVIPAARPGVTIRRVEKGGDFLVSRATGARAARWIGK